MSNWYIEHQSSGERHNIRLTGTVYRGRTRFQSVRIVDSQSYGRILILDGDIQLAEADEGTYHEVLVHPAMMTHPKPRKVLIMGGGEGATLREILRHPTVEKVVMVDLDGQLVELCKEYLPQWSQGTFNDSRLTYLADDARAYVDATHEQFDVIVHDLPQPVILGQAIPELIRLFSHECFESMRRCLTPDGVVCLQSCSARVHSDDIYRVVLNTMRQIFPVVAPMHVYIPSFANDWGFLLGSRTHDPRKLAPEAVEHRLSQCHPAPGRGRGNGSVTRTAVDMQYYSGTIHPTLFTFPPHRPAPVSATAILRDGHPFPALA